MENFSEVSASVLVTSQDEGESGLSLGSNQESVSSSAGLSKRGPNRRSRTSKRSRRNQGSDDEGLCEGDEEVELDAELGGPKKAALYSNITFNPAPPNQHVTKKQLYDALLARLRANAEMVLRDTDANGSDLACRVYGEVELVVGEETNDANNRTHFHVYMKHARPLKTKEVDSMLKQVVASIQAPHDFRPVDDPLRVEHGIKELVYSNLAHNNRSRTLSYVTKSDADPMFYGVDTSLFS